MDKRPMIWKIFRHDLKELHRSIFTLIIAIGVCFLGGLYAWANIYSNWDPYGNTKGIQIALVSLDQGEKDENGKEENLGADLVKKLRENDKIDWVFLDSEDAAREGVRAGSYYGALIIDQNFSHKLLHIFSEPVDHAQLHFYQNQKKNAVANKITDTVMGSVQNQVNEQFVDTLTQRVFANGQHFANQLEERGGVDRLTSELEQMRGKLMDYEGTIDLAISGNDSLRAAIAAADWAREGLDGASSLGQSQLSEGQSRLEKTRASLREYQSNASQLAQQAQANAQQFAQDLSALINGGDVSRIRAGLSDAMQPLEHLDESLNRLANALPAGLTPHLQDWVKRSTEIKSSLKDLSARSQLSWMGKEESQLTAEEKEQKQNWQKDLKSLLEKSKALSAEINQSLAPEITKSFDSLSNTMESARSGLRQVSGILSGVGDTLGALTGAVNAGDVSLTQTKQALVLLDNRITRLLDAVKQAKDNDKLQALIDTISGDPSAYGQFFADPVTIESNAIYPVANYGSAVAPFYSVLAIWVTGLLLAAILRTHPDVNLYPGVKPHQLYFGRYLTFLLLEQFFVLLLCLGNILVLGIQCEHPILFWASSAITGVVFSLLIYSLVYAFGDVGKAAAVVIVVLQIAGSSGTYPIELLPSFFQNAYLFFPFPYAINALREAMAGLYGLNILLDLAKLMIFFLLALAVGLWIQRPAAKLLSFMEKRMEDTDLM